MSMSEPARSTDVVTDDLIEALQPFATFGVPEDAAEHPDLLEALMRDRICDWFGPSDFRAVRALLARISRAPIEAVAGWQLVPIDATNEMRAAGAAWANYDGIEDQHLELHLYEDDAALVIRSNGNKTLYGMQHPELLAHFDLGAGDTDELVERATREAAVASVDARYGYTYEFSSQPVQHRHEYDIAESAIRAEMRPVAKALTSLRAELAEAACCQEECTEPCGPFLSLQRDLAAAESSLAAEKQLHEQAEEAIATQNGVIVSFGQRVVELERVLRKHHDWHAKIGTVVFPAEEGQSEPTEIDLSTEYGDSTLCEETMRALK